MTIYIYIYIYISIITLNVNGLNVPTKRHKLAEWKKRERERETHIYAVYNRATLDLDTNIDWKREDGKRYSMKIEIKRKSRGNSHIRQNDLKIKNITRDMEGHYIMIKGSIKEEDLIIVNIYAPQHRSTSIHKTNTNRYKRGNGQKHNHSWKL